MKKESEKSHSRGHHHHHSHHNSGTSSSTADRIEIEHVDVKAMHNGRLHHTDQYDHVRCPKSPVLVVRRGAAVDMDVKLSRDPSLATEMIGIIMEIGDKPSESKRTRIVIPITKWKTHHREAGDHGWAIELKNLESKSGTVSIHIGVNAIVGCWRLKFIMVAKEDRPASNLVEAVFGSWGKPQCMLSISEIYILFNPWCKDDYVYMEEEYSRQEYVLNDVGKIFRGTYTDYTPLSWVYGQFERDVLNAVMVVLEKTELPLAQRASAIRLSRAITAIANINDDNGILEGIWEEDEYPDGTPPSHWTGSIEILRKYIKNGKGVKYGQCWVFAGIVCTICRCLGLPCRVITTYKSAHDSDSSLTIDYHSDEDGRPIKHLNGDKVWNYHCWNEVWMTRPDLPTGYDGWQVVDGTPQERSRGKYQLGPTSVLAVKRGEVCMAFDTPFVFAEVNADYCYWLYHHHSYKLLRKDTKKVGKMIVTKRPGPKLAEGCADMMDVTHEYKPFEGTKEERKQVMAALFAGGKSVITAYQNEIAKTSDMECDLDTSDKAVIGDDFSIILKMKNKSKSHITVEVYIRIEATLYTDTRPKKVKSSRETVAVKHGDESRVKVTVPSERYMSRLKDQCLFAITAMAFVKETGQVFTTKEDFRLKKPGIKITIDGKPTIFKTFKATAEFTNPLNSSLTDGKFIIDGPGLITTTEIDVGHIKASGVAKTVASITPWKTGERCLVAHFNSPELADVDGFINVTVTE